MCNSGKITEMEFIMIWNLYPHNAEEAKAFIPSLAHYPDQLINEVIADI